MVFLDIGTLLVPYAERRLCHIPPWSVRSDPVLDPSKRRFKLRIEAALEGFRCPHGGTVELIWHPNRPEGWFDIRAHCPEGEAGATGMAGQILQESGISSHKD